MMSKRPFSYRLWNWLNSLTPLRHPYTRLLQQEYIYTPRRRQWANWIWFLIIAVIMAWLITSTRFLISSVAISLLAVVWGGNILGILISTHAIAVMHAERRKQRGNLLIITPTGYIGMVFSVLYIALRRPRWVQATIMGLIDVARFATFCYILIALPLTLVTNTFDILYAAILFWCLINAIRFEIIQSTILGGIVGIFIISRTRSDRTASQFLAIGLFILIQGFLYSASLIIFLWSLLTSPPNHLFIFALFVGAYLAILFMSREFLIDVLYTTIRQDYGEKEVDLATFYNNL